MSESRIGRNVRAARPDCNGARTGARRLAAFTRSISAVRENPDLRSPRQELYLEIARTERALREGLDDLRRRLRVDRSDPRIPELAADCEALSAQLQSCMNLIGPGHDEDATRAVADGLALRLRGLLREICESAS
jgi:hypothetical protein